MNTSPQQAADTSDKTSKPSQPSTSSSPWLGLKDARIVRVLRAFGGKDRHSKVRTVRGLRDRRVRLSVPTAIQLYDLQDRLGLNQPSKVVDWLLNAAKDDVDQLPPLQIPPSGFDPDRPLHGTRSDKEIKIGEGPDNCARTSFWSQESSESNKFKPMSNASDQYTSSLCQWEPNSGHGFESLPASTLSLSSGPRANYLPAATSSSQFNQFQMFMMSSSGPSSLQNLLPNSHLYQSMRPFHFSVSAPRNNSEGENEEK